MRRVRTAVAAAGLLLLSACGTTAPRSSDGFADLDSLGLADTDRVLVLSLGPSVLRFVAGQLDDEPETQALLQGLDGVRLRVYEIDGDSARVAARVDRMSDRLQSDGWEAVLRVREGREQTHMLMRTVDQRVRGITVLASDGETEAVVINLMGQLQPGQFANVMAALDVNAAGVQDVHPQADREG